MNDIFDELITNRVSNNTYYNASDLNRVEQATKEIAFRLTEEGYPAIISTLNWLVGDIPTYEDMRRYLNNLKLVKRQFMDKKTDLPDSMNALTYIGANDIEKFLQSMDAKTLGLMFNHRFCGHEVFCGGDEFCISAPMPTPYVDVWGYLNYPYKEVWYIDDESMLVVSSSDIIDENLIIW